MSTCILHIFKLGMDADHERLKQIKKIYFDQNCVRCIRRSELKLPDVNASVVFSVPLEFSPGR